MDTRPAVNRGVCLPTLRRCAAPALLLLLAPAADGIGARVATLPGTHPAARLELHAGPGAPGALPDRLPRARELGDAPWRPATAKWVRVPAPHRTPPGPPLLALPPGDLPAPAVARATLRATGFGGRPGRPARGIAGVRAPPSRPA